MEKNNRNILGPAIKFYRRKSGLTQKCMTELLNNQGVKIDRPMLAKIENQTRELYDYEVLAIATIFEIDSNDLFRHVEK